MHNPWYIVVKVSSVFAIILYNKQYTVSVTHFWHRLQFSLKVAPIHRISWPESGVQILSVTMPPNVYGMVFEINYHTDQAWLQGFSFFNKFLFYQNRYREDYRLLFFWIRLQSPKHEDCAMLNIINRYKLLFLRIVLSTDQCNESFQNMRISHH